MALQERLALVISGGAVALLLQQLWIYAQRSRLPCPPPRRKAEDEEDEAADVQKKPQAVPRRSSPQPPPETGFADQFVQGLQKAVAGSQPTKAATGQQASNAPEVPPKLVLAPLAPASPPLVGGGAGSEAATATAKSLAGCNMVGWGNNEDGQLVPAGPAHSGSMTEVLPALAPGTSPRLVAMAPPPSLQRSTSPPSSTPMVLRPDSYALPASLHHLTQGRTVVNVSCGSRHTLAVTSDGLVYAWGWAALGQLGDSAAGMAPRGNSLNSLGRRAPSSSSGNGGNSSEEASCRPIEFLANLRGEEGLCVEVSAGGMHSACRFASGHVYTWGMSTFGQLGHGGLSTAAASSVRQPGLVCLPLENGNGNNGSTSSKSTSSGSSKQNKKGANKSASSSSSTNTHRGTETTSSSTTSASGSTNSTNGSSSSAPKEGPPKELQPGQPVVATSISCGGMHTCCVGAHGELYAWGRADQGQLGLGRNWMQLATSRGSGGSSAAHKNLKGVCWPTRVEGFGVTEGFGNSEDPVVQVSCGGFHTAAVTASGALYCWGREEWGCLGIHFTGDRLISGVYLPQQVELPPGSSRVTSVSCGGSHTLAVDEQKRALCCGKNEHGRLGLGPGAWKNKLTFEVVPSLQGEVLKVAAGGSHSLFVTTDHALWACGRTSLGRLGLPEEVLAAPDLPGGMSKGSAAKAAAAKAADDDNRGLGTPNCVAAALPQQWRKPLVVSAGGQHSCVVFN